MALTEFARKSKGYGTTELAKLLECSPSMVCLLRKGVRRPGRRLAAAIARVLGIPVERWDRA